MNQLKMIVRAMFSRRWLAATALVVVVVGIFIRLGFWQLDRLEQRRALNAQRLAVLEGSPLRLPADTLPADLTDVQNRLVKVTGTYDFENELLLVLQNWNGRSGAHLITPLLIAGEETAVLVDRGWVPDEEVMAGQLTQYRTEESVTVDGYIALSERSPGTGSAASVRPENEIYRVEITAVSAKLPYELLPIYIIESPGDQNDQPPFKAARDIDLSEGSHLSYAIQWFLFALTTVILYGVLMKQRGG